MPKNDIIDVSHERGAMALSWYPLNCASHPPNQVGITEKRPLDFNATDANYPIPQLANIYYMII
jgi:hypothetical protein